MAHELLSGTSAVWILLEGSKTEENNAAHAMLRQQLEMIAQQIELEEQPSFEDDKCYGAI